MGIIAGLGRGRPPVPPGRGIRWSPPCRDPWSRRCVPERPTPIPWETANGLLPGRGVPGRRACEPGVGAEPPGRGPGRAPGRGPGPSLGAGLLPPGRGVAPGRGADCLGAAAPGRDAPGLGLGRPGEGLGTGRADSAGLGGAVGVGAPGVATGFDATGSDGVLSFPPAGRGVGFVGEGLGAAGLATAVSALGAYASRTLRTTGASRVDEALETYSPISVSFFKSSLLVIPISFAISWTRGLATTLLRKGHERTRTPLAH